MTLLASQPVGPNEILSAIGAGGMGGVYKARDDRLYRIVAIKVLPPRFLPIVLNCTNVSSAKPKQFPV